MKKQILIYQTASGKEPFTVWFNKIKDKTIKARIYQRVNEASLGYYGQYKRLGKGLIELKLHFGKGYRIYFAELENIILLILTAGTKNTDKEQSKDIAKAREYLEDFLTR
ncbi:MAG: type II toxin-antitoxin system RelE/ParE family toxin [Elusimicrobiaceae bacterium]|nr:type II toxin-antitoxin system RelE/ParE family toxin [Elusimicrobiaceae bacterium]